MDAKAQMDLFLDFGMKTTEKFFEKRGNKSYVKLDRNHLSALLAYAYESGYKKGKSNA